MYLTGDEQDTSITTINSPVKYKWGIFIKALFLQMYHLIENTGVSSLLNLL